jgi:hypothetical protein
MYIICDIDGTLADIGDRDRYDMEAAKNDKLFEDVAHLLSIARMSGWTIYLLTGRKEEARGVTTNWLNENGVVYDELILRGNSDRRSNADYKKQILCMLTESKGKPVFVLEDNLDVVYMCREELKISCFHVRDYKQPW